MMANNLLKYGFLSVERTAILLCDMQEKFRPMIKHFDEILVNAARLAKASKILNIPLIVTEQYPEVMGPTVPEIEIDHAVGVFSKGTFSMCTPDVCKEMKKIMNLQCIVLCGIATHVCVHQTAIDLLQQGLYVHVVADSSSTIRMEDRMVSLENMGQMGCFITTTESVILKLLQNQKNPKFNEVQSLLKGSKSNTGLCAPGIQ